MTDERPSGSHRRSNQGARLRVLLGSLLLVVVAALGVMWALHSRGEGSRLPRPTAGSTTSHTPSTSTGRASSSSASSSAAASSTSPAPASSAASPSPPTLVFTKPTSTPTATATPTSTPVVRPPVDVLNDSRIVGLAARAARTLTAAGWKVEKTGNYGHSLGATTVFYPSGQLSAAKLLASQFPKIADVLPAPEGLSASRLTLVLTKDWSSSGG